ncbi:mitochondrial import receptor subunit TOM20 homolog [Bacillus rossius redtenbacheri]|uniref:mitochondrial import receptor subunit TOM20 homolog n=1 Tax=Bacillus rossius redtenbacheri TaxID=93214 RepID=UPI002FDED945
MTMVSKAALGIAAGICGIVAVGYCIYFDNKRRSDPNFKQKLRERRRAARKTKKSSGTKLPDLKDHEAVQRFFIQEVQLGEELLAGGSVEAGVQHLANAVSVCGQPQQLLQVLQQSLPPQVFHLLLQSLPAVGQRMMAQSAGPLSAVGDDDVE